MRTRGRPAAAEKTVVAGAFGRRPDPPADLTPRQAAIWKEIVASEDAGFFATGALRGMLSDLCRHRESAENLNVELNKFKPAWLKTIPELRKYQTLLTMRDVEVKSAAALATKLRVTNQSRYMPNKAARLAEKTPKILPWES